jgi:cellulose synthase/poly-beta-1,6-N-acetylglucosamine synthase-like glycosyltransferase/peptidoglycan/xylan/chitin deacetylase (PgdA/CDA1 family)/spore germination protein YaaH
MSNPVFLDPQRKRWRRLRLITDPLGILVTVLIVFFAYSLVSDERLTNLLLPDMRRSLKALKTTERRVRHRTAVARRNRPPSQTVLNSDDEGVRAAFYVPWDEASYASLKEYSAQIDLLFPEWLHVITPDGRLQAVTESNTMFDLVQGNTVHTVDPQHKVMQFLREEKAQTEVFPLVNNYDSVSNQWLTSIGQVLKNPDARRRFRRELMQFLATDQYHGVSLDLEEIPLDAQPGYNALVLELATELHSRGMKLYLNLPPHDTDFDYPFLAAQADGLILMDYDEHAPGLSVGSIAAQDWYVNNLRVALKNIPLQKVIAGIGNYGYDWTVRKGVRVPTLADTMKVSVEEAWLHAQESDGSISFDPDTLNPHYGYIDESNLHHEVWFLDAVTALNQMRAVRSLGINTFALWRLGSEDGSLWSVWDHPRESDAAQKLRSIPPGQDVDLEGKGEILRIERTPDWGWRDVTTDADSQLVTGEAVSSYPMPFQVSQYGASKRQVAISFDDGPDPTYTPRILDILKKENAKAIFFVIGAQAEKFPELTRRIYDEGHEIGNHTFTHPDISNISNFLMRLELNSTERLFEARLGIKPLFFRPPYSIDAEPDTAEQVEPLRLTQDMGYITVGAKLDPNDWRTTPRRTPEDLTADVIQQLTVPHLSCTQTPCANIVLLHDGGGNREATVRALPMIIQALRDHGFEIVPVSELLGKTRAEVMPPLSTNERWAARIDNFGFTLYGFFYYTTAFIFFLGNILMTSRLVIIGSLAVYDRFRKARTIPGTGAADPAAYPPVAVLIPAYNEERVIVSTVRSVLASEYPAGNLRIIVIDDGSTDATLRVARQAFASEIAAGRVLVLTKPNAGKAEALNFGLAEVRDDEPIFIGIDADTMIAPSAIARLVPHFENPKVAAVAGNAKVGNRVNLWTRWQALEYITSQNFERRALNALGAVSVVPGAIGAWRTSAVRAAGGYQLGTVAEDADLTMSLLEAGHRVEYEDRSLAFTEAPSNPNGLMRQRFRWSFGILQSLWKHRGAFRRKGALGWFALPNIAIFQILLPVVSPLIDLMFVFGTLSYLVDHYFHPYTANPSSFEKLLLFFVVFLVTDFIASVIAFSLERHEPGTGEDVWLLSQVWLQRFAYRQLFSLVLFKTLKRAIDGRPFSWDKLERTAGVTPRRADLVSSDRADQTPVATK